MVCAQPMATYLPTPTNTLLHAFTLIALWRLQHVLVELCGGTAASVCLFCQ